VCVCIDHFAFDQRREQAKVATTELFDPWSINGRAPSKPRMVFVERRRVKSLQHQLYKSTFSTAFVRGMRRARQLCADGVKDYVRVARLHPTPEGVRLTSLSFFSGMFVIAITDGDLGRPDRPSPGLS